MGVRVIGVLQFKLDLVLSQLRYIPSPPVRKSGLNQYFCGSEPKCNLPHIVQKIVSEVPTLQQIQEYIMIYFDLPSIDLLNRHINSRFRTA